MKYLILPILLIFFSCNTNQESKENNSKSNSSIDIPCSTDVCIEMINSNSKNKTFEIIMKNNVIVAGFQLDIIGAEIIEVKGGILEKRGFDVSNNTKRVLAFSMSGKTIDLGSNMMSVIKYGNQKEDEICLDGIVFAGQGGAKLSVNEPKCLKIK
tara:strand:- start:10644 stop:11108 length:465 start_codon:yes stop_codon:yes gene_type:complete